MASEASYEQTLVSFPVLLSPDFSLLSKMRSLHGGYSCESKNLILEQLIDIEVILFF